MNRISITIIHILLIPSLLAVESQEILSLPLSGNLSEQAFPLHDLLLKEQLTLNVSRSRKIKKTKRQLEEALNQLKLSQHEQSHLEEQIADFNAQKEQMKGKIANLEQETIEKRAAYKQYKKLLSESAQKIHAQEQSMDALRESLSAQCAHNATLQKDLLLAEATSSSIAEEASTLKTNLELAKKEMLASVVEKTTLQEQLVQALQENEERSLLLTKLQNSLHIQEKGSIYNQREKELMAVSESRYEIREETQALIDRLNSEIANLSRQQKLAHNQVHLLETSNHRLEEQLTIALHNYATMQAELSNKTIAYSQLQEDLFAMTNEKNNKELTLLVQSREFESIKNEAQMLHAENQSLRTERKSLICDSQGLKVQLDTMNHSYLALKSELNALTQHSRITHSQIIEGSVRSLHAQNNGSNRRHKVLRKTIYT